jgi:hypothetical protein
LAFDNMIIMCHCIIHAPGTQAPIHSWFVCLVI